MRTLITAILFAFAVAGCGHKQAATGTTTGSSTVKTDSDKHTDEAAEDGDKAKDKDDKTDEATKDKGKDHDDDDHDDESPARK